MSNSTTTATDRTWVAFGPVGAVGAIHQIGDTFAYRLMDEDFHGMYPTLDAAKGALHAALKPGSEWPEFREH
jgi:hypothetical protein